jgi:hypothetical protein
MTIENGKPTEWQFYMRRKGKYFFRREDGARCSFQSAGESAETLKVLKKLEKYWIKFT